MGYLQPGQDGRGAPGWGTSLARDGVPPLGIGYSPGQGWGTPWDKTTDGALATQRAVWLLLSRRRTVLFTKLIFISNC